MGGNNKSLHIRPKGLRKALMALVSHCPYCGGALDEHNANLEHIIPKSKGGTRALVNMTIAHWKCNVERGTASVAGRRFRTVYGWTRVK